MVQVDFPSVDAPPITIKIEPKNIPVKPELKSENLDKGRFKKIQRLQFVLAQNEGTAPQNSVISAGRG